MGFLAIGKRSAVGAELEDGAVGFRVEHDGVGDCGHGFFEVASLAESTDFDVRVGFLVRSGGRVLGGEGLFLVMGEDEVGSGDY